MPPLTSTLPPSAPTPLLEAQPTPANTTTTPAHPHPKPPHTLPPLLQTPLLLLPPHARKPIQSKPIHALAWTKNQNIRAGVSKLLAFLDQDGSARNGKDDAVLVVSAAGQASVRLVGVWEIVRRVLEERGEEGEAGAGKRWWVYTVLSSVALGGDADGDAEMEVETPTKTRTQPVLSLWLSSTRIPGWVDAFGEVEITVHDGVASG